MLLELGENKTNLDSIGRLAVTWIGLKEKRPGDGIMLAGIVRAIASQGQVYRTEVELFSDDKQMVTVISKIDPRKKIDESDRVIILGTVVQDPSLKLAGYEGSLPLVIWGGFPVALPKADANQSGGDANPPKGGGEAPGSKQG